MHEWPDPLVKEILQGEGAAVLTASSIPAYVLHVIWAFSIRTRAFYQGVTATTIAIEKGRGREAVMRERARR